MALTLSWVALGRAPASAVALALALAAVGIVVAVFALAPRLVALGCSTRPLPRSLRADVAPDGVEVRVVASGGAGAFAAGVLPGGERVFVTERLVAEWRRDELAAVVAHEAGHVERGHARQRCAALAATAAVCVVVGPGLDATAAAVAALTAGVAALAWLGRRHERAADADAVRRAGADATRRALRRFDAATAGPLARVRARLGVRSPLGRRADRLEV